MPQALNMLLENNIKPIARTYEWQGFRDELMWRIECGDVMDCNQDGLMQVFTSISRDKRGKYIYFDVAIEFFS